MYAANIMVKSSLQISPVAVRQELNPSFDGVVPIGHRYRYNTKRSAGLRTYVSDRYELYDRVVYIDGGNLKDMAGRAEGFLTVNSSAGIEALAADCPTFSIMPTIYDIKGLTFSGELDAFWKEGRKPNADLFKCFCDALAGTIQVRGTIYNDEGVKAAAEAIAERLVADQINEPGGFVPEPPRLEKAARMGVYYN